MGGYLSTSKTFTVKDTCYHTDFYNDTATASATITAGTGNTASWSIIVTTSDWNYIQIYLEINGTVVLNKKDTSGKMEYTYSGYGAISGDNVNIRLGVGCSQYTESTMTFTTGTLKRNKETEAWTEVGTGKTTIKDNGNNTFTITAVAGASGINNPATVVDIKWGYNTNYSNSYIGGNINLKLDDPGNKTNISNTKTVYAKSTTIGDYGNSKTATTSLAVKQYFVPYAPTSLKITHSKSRLTVKENWTCKWTASKTPNSNSAVKGYKIMIYKSGTPINGIKINSNNKITKDTSTGTTKYNYVHVGAAVTKVKVDPVSLGLAPGNKVKFSVTPYTVWGYNTSVKKYGAIKISNEETVQNAGIMYVKINGTWREGQVYVKNSGTWQEAEAIYVKNSGTWQESQ